MKYRAPIGSPYMIEQHPSSSAPVSSQDPRIFVKRKMPKVTPFVLTALLVLVIALGSIGVVLVQRQLKLAQDTRNQASVAGGIVDVVASKVNDPALNQPFQIKFDVNTHQTQIDGVQLMFTISGPNMSDVQLAFPNTQLQTLVQNVQPISANSYRVTAVVVPANVGSAYSNNSNTTFLTLTATPTSYGNIAITYDNTQSLSTVFNSDPPQDQLKTLATTNFVFAAPASPSPVVSPSPSPVASPTPSPVASPTPSPAASPTPSPTPTPSVSPTPSPAASPTPTPTPSPAPQDDLLMEANNQHISFYTLSGEEVASNSLIIGTTYNARFNYTIQNILKSSANSTIKIYAVLKANGNTSDATYITYGLIRQHRDGGSGTQLQTNFTAQATNTFQVDIDTTDAIDELNENNNSYVLIYTASNPGSGGVATVGCNQSCSSSAQCENNLFCYNNQCRLAANPGSDSCSQASSSPDNGIARSCDEYCSDSRECGSGYTCYYNKCRRPDNVSSTSCSAAVVNTYVPNWSYSSAGTGTAKGSTPPTYVADGSLSSSPAPEIGTEYFAPEAINTFSSPTPDLLANSPEPTMVDGSAQPEGPMQWIMSHLMTLIGGLLAIIALIVAIVLLGRNKKNPPTPPTGGAGGFSNGRPVSPTTSAPSSSLPSSSMNRSMSAASKDNYEEQLQKRISDLQLPKPPVSALQFAANPAPKPISTPLAGNSFKEPAFVSRPTTPITAATAAAPMAMGFSDSTPAAPKYTPAVNKPAPMASSTTWDTAADNEKLPSISLPKATPAAPPSMATANGGFGAKPAAAPMSTSAGASTSDTNSMMSRLKSRGSYNAFVNSSTN